MIQMEKLKHMIGAHLAGDEHKLVLAAVMLVAGFVSSFGKLLGHPSQMNVAVAVLAGENILPVFVGSALGYAVMGSFTQGAVQLCAMLVIAGLRWILPADKLGSFGRKSEPALTSLITCGVLILFSCVMSAAMPSNSFLTSLRMINALLCGCTVFSAMNIMQSSVLKGIYNIGGVNGIYIGIVYVMAVSTLTSVPAGVFNLGRAAGCFCMLMAVRRFHQTGGAVAGALTTCGVLICAPMLAKNTLLLATSGLICGVFACFGMTVTVLVFIAVSLISLAALGVNSDTFPMLADILLGSLVFFCVPLPAVKKLTRRITGFESSVDIVSQTTASKLGFASSEIGEIRSQLSQVTAAMQRRAHKTDICAIVCKAACTDCPFAKRCFEHKQQLDRSLAALAHISAKFNCISQSDVALHLPSCRRPEYMTERFNHAYSLMISEKANDMRMGEMRGLMCEQLSCMQDILRDLSLRAGQVRSIDTALSAQVRNCFDALGYPNAKACVYVDDELNRRADVYLTADYCGDLVKLTSKVSAIIGCVLDVPVCVKSENMTRMTFCETPAFEVQTASFCASRSGEYSGDTYEIIDISAAEKYIILSDGMGTGKRARLDSVFSVSLVSRLLRCGMSVTTAHKMVNSMMRVKGWEESFATLDIVRLDLCGGSAGLMKSGAAASYLCRDGGLKVFTSDAFPAGILPACRPDTADIKLFDGDILMLASDGVEQSAARRLAVLSRKCADTDKLCSELGAYCMDICGGEPKDDLTIILVKIIKKRTNCLKD